MIPLLIFSSFRFLLVLIRKVIVLGDPPKRFTSFKGNDRISTVLFAFLRFKRQVRTITRVRRRRNVACISIRLFFQRPRVNNGAIRIAGGAIHVDHALRRRLSNAGRWVRFPTRRNGLLFDRDLVRRSFCLFFKNAGVNGV